GYRIWYNPELYIEGERHVVWTDMTRIRDVSFVSSGERRTVFVPDGTKFDERPRKVRHAFALADQRLLAQIDVLENETTYNRLDPKVAWETMLSYEQWLAGERMPDVWAQIK
ncbi:hypothetical protein ACS0Y3_36810, partial [Burkholderia gladioli]|uniref:hypothetical protein n=1 Tax=Burkholderia gladioli TaxID=28095 RepID=UPI003F79AC56